MEYKSKYRKLYVVVGLILAAINPVAIADHVHRNSGHQKWRAGWDIFDEQLDYNTGEVTWKHSPGRSLLIITYTLRGATPNRQYQVGVHIFDICPTTFGQFPSLDGCAAITREGVTRVVEGIELGVVTTDSDGNGSFTVSVNGIEPGTYQIIFDVRAGVGCNLPVGCGGCAVVFQSP